MLFRMLLWWGRQEGCCMAMALVKRGYGTFSSWVVLSCASHSNHLGLLVCFIAVWVNFFGLSLRHNGLTVLVTPPAFGVWELVL
jgi:hypothetical protein